MKSNNLHIDWEIISGILDNSATAEEKRIFNEWIEDEQNKVYFHEIKDTWNETGKISHCFDNETNNAWKIVSSQTVSKSRKKTKSITLRIVQVAAAIAILFVAGKFIFFPGKEVLLSNNSIIKEFSLPDESTVSLNKNSKLTYVKNFRGRKRKLSLEGEAFFDVKRNPAKPFIIHTSKGTFEVLGTSFNISCYEKNNEVELNVATGKVKFTSVKSEEYTIVQKGETIKYNYKNNKLIKSNNTNSNYLAWKTKQIVFDNTPLKQVIKCLESVYNTKINIKNKQLETLRFSAGFDNQPLEKILKVIALTFDIEIKRVNETVELYIPEE